ncbi:MAG TPA: MarR family transcriptional regulator [Pirellulaceae bacterium]|nr:MarR family transcriptional regulator [Pirellulaceae bacterium]
MKNHVSLRPTVELSQIGFLLGRAYDSYMGFLEHLLEESGLGDHIKPGMGSLLFALFREDDRTISEVARELQLARSTMTGMVARMKKARLINVVRCRQDSRALRLRLTPLARSLEPRCQQLASRVERILSGDLSAEESRNLRRLLTIVIGTINAGLGSPRREPVAP